MSEYPGRAKLVKGAFVQAGLTSIPRKVTFRYNPDKLTRTLNVRKASAHSGNVEANTIAGAPTQNISLDIELSAVDQLEKGDAIAKSLGIYPELSALELLIYPGTPYVIAETAMLAAGMTEIAPPQGASTLFVWGLNRVLPVRIQGFTITEDTYDPQLNPKHAKVSVQMDVISYSDVSVESTGFHLSLAHQIKQEAYSQMPTGISGSINASTFL